MIPDKTLYRLLSCSILSCSLLLCLSSSAQKLPDNILFEKVQIPGTIRSSQVSDIVQDNHGLIWIAGDYLYQYDGFQFREYRDLSDGKSRLGPNEIHCLFYDGKSDRLLLGTHKYGIVAFDFSTGKLIPFPSTTSPIPVIHQIARTEDGKIWVGSHGSGLFFLENDTLKESPESKKYSIYPLSLTAVDKKLYIGESAHVYVIEGNELVDKIKLEWDGKALPGPTRITAITHDCLQNIWLGTEGQGVFVYSLKQKKFTKHFDPSSPPFFSRISRIREDRSGLVWILTKASGAAVYSPEDDRMMFLRKDPFTKTSISSDNCFSMLEDSEGIIWIGATGDLNKYDPQQIRISHIFHNPMDKISLTDNMVRGLAEDHLQRLWVGTDGGRINIIDRKKQHVEQVKITMGNDSTNYVPMYFAQLSERIMLVGTSFGLLQYDLQSKKFSPFKPTWEITKGRTVRQILIKNNVLYFITVGSLYTYEFDSGKTERFSQFGHKLATNVTTFLVDDENQIWVGLNRGVAGFDRLKKDYKFVHFEGLPLPSERSLLLVLSIEQVDKKIFVGTFNAGLWEIDVSNPDSIPKPKRYTEEDGMPSNTVYSTVPTDDGVLWMSTNAGLSQFNPARKQFISFSVNEGLQDEEFNRLAYLKRSDGQLVFGGINGINILDPKNISVNPEVFTPVISGISCSNPLAPEEASNKSFPGSERMSLAYDQNFLNFNFFVPNYQLPRRYKILYHLKNFEKDWNEATGMNVASYGNLQPGDYVFMVKTVSLNGQENLAQLPVTIKPPYWKAWWFVLLSFFTVSFLVMTIIRSYIRKAQFDRQRLEELLKIRTFEIERSKEELRILNEKKDLIFSILSHDLRSPLTTLKGFLGYLISHAHEMSIEDLKKHAVNIKNSVTNSLDLIDNTLFWSLSQMGNIQYSPVNFSLQGLLEKLHGLYQLTADKKKIRLTISCDDDLIIHGDENMIYVTLRNLVSNALKFSEEGKSVSITGTRKEGYAEVNVIDSGIGMSQEYLKRVLSTDQPMLKKGTSNEKGTGLGLILCKKFIEMNKGEIRITSVENVGTTFTVILPLAVHQPASVS